MIRIISLQLEINDLSKSARIKAVLNQIAQTPESDLILLPEIWPTGFFNFDQYADESEAVTGDFVSALREKAIQRQCHLHTGSFVEKEGNQLYNTSLLVDPAGEIISRYRKIHLFGYQSKEQQILTPGNEVATVKTPLGHIGLATCYDLRFPELFRKMSEKGVDLILVTSAWPLARLSAWTLFNQARAHENLSFLVSCNCAGTNMGTPYAGHSMIVAPSGEILAQGNETPGVVSGQIDLEAAADLRREFPALGDRVFY